MVVFRSSVLVSIQSHKTHYDDDDNRTRERRCVVAVMVEVNVETVSVPRLKDNVPAVCHPEEAAARTLCG